MLEQLSTPLRARCGYGLDSFIISVLASEAFMPEAGSATLACGETKDVREVKVGDYGMRLFGIEGLALKASSLGPRAWGWGLNV